MMLGTEYPVLEGVEQRVQAARLTVDAHVQPVLSREVAISSLNEAERRREREEVAACIRALRRWVTLGPDLTIGELIEEGRHL